MTTPQPTSKSPPSSSPLSGIVSLLRRTTSVFTGGAEQSGMSLAFRREAKLIKKGIYPQRFQRVLTHLGDVRGRRFIEVGGAEGTMSALLKTSGAARVVMVERQTQRYEMAVKLHQDKGIEFFSGNILENLHLLDGLDTLISLRCIYHLGPRVHDLFSAARKSTINFILLEGNETRRDKMDEKNRPGVEGYEPVNQTWGNVLAIPEGMTRLLNMHGFATQVIEDAKSPLVIGRKA
jgi:hypothetical protein